MDQKNDIQSKVDDLLCQWGRWAENCPVSVGFPSQTPYRRLMGSSVGSLQIDPETAMTVDSVVSELERFDPLAKEVIQLYYVCRMNLRDMKKETPFYIEYHKARELRKVGLGFCVGRLYEHVTV